MIEIKDRPSLNGGPPELVNDNYLNENVFLVSNY